MTEAEIYQWIGYLANPARRANLQVELHPKKELEFRVEYHQLTGRPLLLPGDRTPFYIWKPDANKWGIQRRVYFYTPDKRLMPSATEQVRAGRAKGQWRINDKAFINRLFKEGFILGENDQDNLPTEHNIPPKFRADFRGGFNIIGLTEQVEYAIKRECDTAGSRTLKLSTLYDTLRKTLPHSRAKLQSAIKTLEAKKAVQTDSNADAITYLFAKSYILKNEIEHEHIRHAITQEKAVERREYLIETYARDAGWKKIARQAFGDFCMYGDCANTFLKADGTPYIEVHHIQPLHNNGSDHITNLSVLCAHHHRMAHFSDTKQRTQMKRYLLAKNRKMVAG